MQYDGQFNELLYHHEILLAKLEIRDHYFKTIVREIYENTGQLLSLVRVQLSIIGRQIQLDQKPQISQSGDLVGKVICDLREMSRNFFPENEILSSFGLFNALKRELNADIEGDVSNKIRLNGVPFALTPESGLIFFSVLLEITFLLIKSYGIDSIKFEITYTDSKVKVCIDYPGGPIDLNRRNATAGESPMMTRLSVKERIKLVGGAIVTKGGKGKSARINVSLPYSKSKAA